MLAFNLQFCLLQPPCCWAIGVHHVQMTPLKLKKSRVSLQNTETKARQKFQVVTVKTSVSAASLTHPRQTPI